MEIKEEYKQWVPKNFFEKGVDFWLSIVYDYDSQKWGDEVAPKMGRPTDNPKPYKLTVRVDEESKHILDQYAKQEQVSQMEAIRRGIKRLEPDIKK